MSYVVILGVIGLCIFMFNFIWNGNVMENKKLIIANPERYDACTEIITLPATAPITKQPIIP